MESMSRSTMQMALGGLVLCGLVGFWLGLQGALPRDSGSGASAPAAGIEPEPNAYRNPVDAAPVAELNTISDEPAASDASDAGPAQSEAPPPPKRAAPAEPRSQPRPEPATALSATPAPPPPVVAPAPAPTPTPPPAEEDLPPY
jgi:hypothetical protein